MRISRIHKRAARMLMMGMRKGMVAKRVGVAPGAITTWCRDMDFMRYLNWLEESCFEDLDREIRWLKTTAVRVIKESLKSRVVDDRRWAVEKVLIMSGVNGKITHEHEHRGKIVHEEAPLSPRGKKLAKAFLAETRESMLSAHGGNGNGHSD